MSANWSADIKTARMQASLNGIDNNASPAQLQLFTDAYATQLVSIVLNKPSFSVSGSTLTMLGMPKSGVAINTGVAKLAVIKDGGGNTKLSGITVGTGSLNEDIILQNPSITAGQTVTLSSSNIAHA